MIKNTLKSISLLIIICSILSACNTGKEFFYFKKGKDEGDSITVAKAYIPRIQTGDILSIYVNSLSPEASSFFNPYSGNNAASSGALTATATSGQVAPTGYLVDPSGEIELPLIGNVKVNGYTTSQVRDTLKKLLTTYLKEPTVLVRLVNFKISILGEVAKPDVYNISNEMITVPEAISMAGDLTLYARRDSIEVIRQVNGKKEFGIVNMGDRNMFSSPYYYLHPNDIIYAIPAKTKSYQTDRTFEFVSIGATLISLLLVLFRN